MALQIIIYTVKYKDQLVHTHTHIPHLYIYVPFIFQPYTVRLQFEKLRNETIRSVFLSSEIIEDGQHSFWIPKTIKKNESHKIYSTHWSLLPKSICCLQPNLMSHDVYIVGLFPIHIGIGLITFLIYFGQFLLIYLYILLAYLH